MLAADGAVFDTYQKKDYSHSNQKKKTRHLYEYTAVIMLAADGAVFDTYPKKDYSHPNPKKKNTPHVRVYGSDHACW